MKAVQGVMLTLAAVIPLYFTGCVNTREIEDSLAVNEDYRQYLEIRENGALDLNGTVSIPTDDESTIPGSGDILVSIAKNQYLDVQCKLTDGTEIADKCCLNAGDTLLIENPVKQNASAIYKFDKFELNANDGYDVDFKVENAENNTYKLTIPDGYRGKSLTVLPLGKFEDRSVVCRAVVIGENGKQTTANGIWGLSDDTYCKVETPAEITTLTFSGTSGYVVKYEFDGDYYYVDETSDRGATVTYNSVSFPSMKPSDATPEYSIKLRRYVTLDFENSNYIDSITVNGIKTEPADNRLAKLKQDDVVNVKLKKGAVFENSEYADNPREHSDGCKEYTLKLPNKDRAELKIGFENVSVTGDFEGVNISYTDQNGKQTSAENLKDDEKYNITITAKDGYKLADNENHFLLNWQIGIKNGVAKLTKIPKNECSQKIREVLENCLKKMFAVYLTESDETGTFKYKLDGDKLTVKNGDPVVVYAGQKLDVTYTVRNGYKIPGAGAFGKDGTEKKVTVEIPSNWEGKTVSLGDYNIEVKKE